MSWRCALKKFHVANWVSRVYLRVSVGKSTSSSWPVTLLDRWAARRRRAAQCLWGELAPRSHTVPVDSMRDGVVSHPITGSCFVRRCGRWRDGVVGGATKDEEHECKAASKEKRQVQGCRLADTRVIRAQLGTSSGVRSHVVVVGW